MGKDSKNITLLNKYNKNNFNKNKFESMNKISSNQSTSSNVKITNITNIILNVKSGTKSLDIRTLNNSANKDRMMRDMNELHIITQKALSTNSNIDPLLDTLDNYEETNLNKRKFYSHFKLHSVKQKSELLINDNSDFNINHNNNDKQIINIININGNYSMDQTKRKNVKKLPCSELSSIQECVYDTSFLVKQSNTQKKEKNENKNCEINPQCDNKQNKVKLKKISKLPKKITTYKGYSKNIETNNSKGDNSIKKYIEHLKNSEKNNGFGKKAAFIDIKSLKK